MKRSTLLWWLCGLWCITAVGIWSFPLIWPLYILSSAVVVGLAALLLFRPYGADERRAWDLYLLVLIWGFLFLVLELMDHVKILPSPVGGADIIMALLVGISLLILIRGRTLEQHPSQKEIGHLIRDLSHSDRDVRFQAVRVLGKVPSPKAIESLVVALADEDEGVRYFAADALGATGDEWAMAPLLRALQDPDPVLCDSAASALGTLGFAEAVPSLVEVLIDSDPYVRVSAAEALGKLKDSRGVQSLIRALEDPDPDVRATAVYALSDLGDPSALPMLQWIQQHDSGSMRFSKTAIKDIAASAVEEIQKRQDLAS